MVISDGFSTTVAIYYLKMYREWAGTSHSPFFFICKLEDNAFGQSVVKNEDQNTGCGGTLP